MKVRYRIAAAVSSTIAVLGLCVAGASAWADVLVPSSSPGLLTLWATDYPIHFSEMQPGDQAYIHVTVELDDTDLGDLSLQIRKDGDLATTAGGLAIDVDRCDLPWGPTPAGISNAATAPTPTCSLGQAHLLTADSTNDFSSDSPTWQLGTISSTARVYLLVRLSIPALMSLAAIEDHSATFAFGLFAEGDDAPIITPTSGGDLAFTGLDVAALVAVAGGSRPQFSDVFGAPTGGDILIGAKPLALLGAGAVIALCISSVVASNASWVDPEWMNSGFRALDCSGSTALASRSNGRFLAGSVGGTSLDPVAALNGIVVSNASSTANAVPGSSTSLGSDAYTSNVTASAINGAVTAGVGTALPVAWPVGVYTQYGQARSTGISTGAAGAITNAGAIDTTALNDGTAPTVGSISISGLALSGSSPLGSATSLDLTIGAVAAKATVDGCVYAWSGDPTAVSRSYSINSLGLRYTDPTIAALFGATGSIATNLTSLQSQLATAFGTLVTTGSGEASINATSVTALGTAVGGVLGSVSGGTLTIGTTGTATTQVSMDLSAAAALIDGTLTDSGTGVSVNLSTGVVTVNLDTLMSGLNGKPANTSVLTSANVATIASTVTALLNARLAAINSAINTAILGATVNVSVDQPVAVKVVVNLGNVLNVHVGYTGTVAQYLAGTETVSGPTVTSSLPAANFLVTPLVSALTASVTTMTTVTTAVNGAVTTNAYAPPNSTASTLSSASASALATVNTATGSLLNSLDDIISIRVNAQPDKPSAIAAPWTLQADEFAVSALTVSVLDAPAGSSLVALYFGSASAGQNAR